MDKEILDAFVSEMLSEVSESSVAMANMVREFNRVSFD